MPNICFLLLLTLAWSNAVHAESWVQVKGHPIAYDKDSLVRNADLVRYWLKTTKDPRKYEIWLKEMDCRNRTDKTVSTIWAYEDGRREEKSPQYGVEQIAPGSQLEVLHGQLCSRFWEFWKR